MKKLGLFQKIWHLALTLIFVSGMSFPSATLAANPRGHQGQIGPIIQPGNNAPTGPQNPTGPQGPTGPISEQPPQDSVLITSPLGPLQPELPITTQPAPPPTLSNNNSNNNADINNNANVNANTGDNTIGANTAVGNLTTGPIDGSLTVINVGNSNLGVGSSFSLQTMGGASTNLLDLSAPTNSSNFSNIATGPGSLNTNVLDSNNVIAVFNSNDANVDNTLCIDANTGGNTIQGNTSVGSITTGDINLGVNMVNILNQQMPNITLSLDIWTIMGDYSGDIVLANTSTGPRSSNQNQVGLNSDTQISVINNADLNNNLSFDTNTGNNNFGQNTSLGDITTGDTGVKSNIVNLANSSTVPTPIYIFNIFGIWDGNYMGFDPSQVVINQMNSQTGPDSQNQNNLAQNDSTTITLQNTANVNNSVKIKANTGGNTIADNTKVGDINTGSINISSNIINLANLVSDKVSCFAIKIINIFGNFHGNIGTRDALADGRGGGGNTGGTPTGTTGQPPVSVPVVPADTTKSDIRISYRTNTPKSGTGIVKASATSPSTLIMPEAGANAQTSATPAIKGTNNASSKSGFPIWIYIIIFMAVFGATWTGAEVYAKYRVRR